MPKCDFNKVALQLYRNRIAAGCSPINLLHVFRAPFPKNTSERLLLFLEILADHNVTSSRTHFPW